MIIYKSQIKIKNMNDKSSLNCELLTRMIYENYTENEISQDFGSILIMPDENGKCSVHDVEEYANEKFYELLKIVQKEHEEYKPNTDMQYILDVFEKNSALSYLDINKYSRIVKIQNIERQEKDVELEIVSYELDEKMIIDDFLGKDYDILDLHDDIFMFDEMINRYIEKKLLIRKMNFLNSIGVIRQYINREVITIDKINGHRIFQININSIDNTILKYKDFNGIKVAFTKVHKIIDKTRYNKVKDMILSENEYGHDMVVIINRGNSYYVLISFIRTSK